MFNMFSEKRLAVCGLGICCIKLAVVRGWLHNGLQFDESQQGLEGLHPPNRIHCHLGHAFVDRDWPEQTVGSIGNEGDGQQHDQESAGAGGRHEWAWTGVATKEIEACANETEMMLTISGVCCKFCEDEAREPGLSKFNW
ncbi:hypothetical protein K438DRAFT_1761020 [Mycena galopus ATCC 62051]|nr:hypothetical protein K438DRAFT_1761020 [Mycena galopus ATCC 62051]